MSTLSMATGHCRVCQTMSMSLHVNAMYVCITVFVTDLHVVRHSLLNRKVLILLHLFSSRAVGCIFAELLNSSPLFPVSEGCTVGVILCVHECVYV